jgi:arabinan endo-1,5-alpha-L-arabinosidase
MRLFVALAAVMFATPALPTPALAQELTGNIAIHDPTIAVLADGFASFATGVEGAADGGQIRTKTSPDGLHWQETGPIPGGMPDWVKEELGFTPKNIWAPAVSEHDGTHYLYYSASSFGRNDSVIGLMTNSALTASDPTAGWEDQGLVLRSRQEDNFNAIDPFRIDTGDTAWLAHGSYWNGIRLIVIDPASGMPLPDAEPTFIASRGGGAIEAPAILEHDGKFYLFVSFDACCRGLASTYRIMVGRADTITGPYLDQAGKPLLEGGGTELVASTGRFVGPGGQEVFMRDGEPWLVFHFYNREQGGTPNLYLAPLQWQDGWPRISPLH